MIFSNSEEMFYQMLLYDFENFSEIRFENPLSIKELAILALNNKESGWCEQDGPIDELTENVKEVLLQKADMLKEYYRISISSSGYLESLPLLLGSNFVEHSHISVMKKLPVFLFHKSSILIEFQIIIHQFWDICRCIFYD